MSRPEIITYEPGTVIYREGDPAENLFFLTQGHVIARFKGREVELAPGSVLGDASLIEGVYWATVAAGESGCTLMALPCSEFRTQIEQSPPLIRVFVETMLKRTETMIKKIL